MPTPPSNGSIVSSINVALFKLAVYPVYFVLRSNSQNLNATVGHATGLSDDSGDVFNDAQEHLANRERLNSTSVVANGGAPEFQPEDRSDWSKEERR